MTSIYEELFGKEHITDASVIEWAEHGRTGGTDQGEAYKQVGDVPFAIKVEEKTDGANTITFVGQSRVGVSESDNEWRIRRVTEFASNASLSVVIEFPNGTSEFTSVWASRASLSYS